MVRRLRPLPSVGFAVFHRRLHCASHPCIGRIPFRMQVPFASLARFQRGGHRAGTRVLHGAVQPAVRSSSQEHPVYRIDDVIILFLAQTIKLRPSEGVKPGVLICGVLRLLVSLHFSILRHTHASSRKYQGRLSAYLARKHQYCQASSSSSRIVWFTSFAPAPIATLAECQYVAPLVIAKQRRPMLITVAHRLVPQVQTFRWTCRICCRQSSVPLPWAWRRRTVPR